MELSLAEIERATGARLLAHGIDAESMNTLRAKAISGWSIDSRSLKSGDLFIAIKGDRFDGHEFIKPAFAAGAVAAVVSEPADAVSGPTLPVDDTARALGEVAGYARRAWNGIVVAITGSAGKTSTKEIVAAFLATRLRVGKTIGNLNNHLGLPLTLLRIPGDTEAAVVELGMNHAGEIAELARIAQPQIGIVTNVGYAHIEAFSSIEGIAAAKRELIEALPSDGVAVLNADDERVAAFQKSHPGQTVTYGLQPGADFWAERLTLTAIGSTFAVKGVTFKTGLTGRHAVSNILAGLAVASLFEIPLEDCVPVAAGLTPGKMRGERYELAGITVLNDSYNSNPEAVRSMIDVLGNEPAQRRIAVLGEMLELGSWGEDLHRQIGRYAVAHGADVLVGIQGESRFAIEEASKTSARRGVAYFFEDPEAAGNFLRHFVKPGDAVLFKGSRGTHVERALSILERSLVGMKA